MRESLRETPAEDLKSGACSIQRIKESVIVLAVLLLAAACAMLAAIPDLDTPDGQVYTRRCGACHGVPDPRFRTMMEWQEVLPKMERLIHERGQQPLTEPERDAIVRYLSRHAKS